MCKFLVCNYLFLNVQYETIIFVVKMIQIQDFVMWSAKLKCANGGQIDILGKIINGHNLRFSVWGLFTFEIQTYWIISVSIFESIFLRFSDFVSNWWHQDLKLHLIISYCFSVSVQRSRPSLMSSISMSGMSSIFSRT
jgi:hypothetical protein